MIINFCYRLDQIQGMSRPAFEHGLRELLRAHRMGHHVLILPRSIAQWLLEAVDLQDIDRSTVFRLQRDYAQTADLPRRASVSIRLQPNDDQMARVPNGTIIIPMTIEEISRAYTLERAAIVVEDSVADGRLYSLLFGFARSKLGINSTSFEVYHGGGSRTIDVAVEKANDKRIVCAIIDSDKRAPSERLIPKVETLNRRASDLPWPLLWAVSPDVREIENLIPLSIVKYLPCSQAHPHLEHLERIEEREKEMRISGCYFLWYHLDIKLGIGPDLLDRVVDATDSAWLIEKLRLISEFGITTIEGFGGNVVDQAVEQVQLHGEFRKAVRASRWWGLFGAHLSFLIWLCAAPNRQFA